MKGCCSLQHRICHTPASNCLSLINMEYILYPFTLRGHCGIHKDLSRDNSYSLENKGKRYILYASDPEHDTNTGYCCCLGRALPALFLACTTPHLIFWLLRTIKLMAATATPGEGWRELSKQEGTQSQKPATSCSGHGCCMGARDIHMENFFSYFEI